MASAAWWRGCFGGAFALMQFVFAPVLGVLSDRFGRRPIILASNLGLGVDYFVMALAPSIGWLFLGRIIAGITAASISTAMAYIADVVTPEKRAGAFGKIGAAFGIGFVLGPALGGLLGNFDPRLPFWVAGCLSLTNGIYCYFLVPESLPSDRRKRFELRRANPIGSLVLLRSHPELFRLPPFNSLATSRTKSSKYGRSTLFFDTPGVREWLVFRSPLSALSRSDFGRTSSCRCSPSR